MHVAGAPFAFRAGESIHTENSYKWSRAPSPRWPRSRGWQLVRTWTDDRAWFSLRLYARAG